jgi:hypothetical protein
MKAKEMLTTDEGVFEFVKQHLITQGQKSEIYGTGCLYKQSKYKLSCAIGCLIEDEFYSNELEFKNIYNPLVTKAIQKSLPNWIMNTEMLVNLQELHDRYEVDEWEWQLEILEKQLFHREELLEEDNKKLMEFFREI